MNTHYENRAGLLDTLRAAKMALTGYEHQLAQVLYHPQPQESLDFARDSAAADVEQARLEIETIRTALADSERTPLVCS